MDQLSNKARDARNEYLRKWKKNNADKVKQYTVTYWERKAGNEVVTAPVTAPGIVTAPVTVIGNTIGNTCIVCGVTFSGKRADSKYCSPACKQKYHREIKRNEK